MSDNENEGNDNNANHDPFVGIPAADLMQFLLHARMGRAAAGDNAGMVEGLKNRKVLHDRNVEDALLALPRGDFVPKSAVGNAYEDAPLRLAEFGFNVSAPHMYAMCLENLELQPGHKFLDIGSGCGHMTCLGGLLVGKQGVSHGLDLRPDIVEFAESKKKKVSNTYNLDLSNVKFMVRNCFLADPDENIYDRIHVGACIPKAHLENLKQILAPNGIIVGPYQDNLIKVTKDANGQCTTKALSAVRYGDLIIPSQLEIHTALLAAERYRALRVVIPPYDFAADMESMVGNSHLSDTTFIAEGASIPVHRFMLALRCPYLDSIAKSNIEGVENGVVLPNVSRHAFVTILKYIYGGHISIGQHNLSELSQAAKEFGLDNLIKACTSYRDNLMHSSELMKGELELNENVAQQFASLVNSPRLSDVTFSVDNKRIHGHRFILSARSQYFRSILTLGLKESAQSEINIPEVKSSSFLSMLQFVYTGNENVINEENLLELLEVSNYFSELRLKAICEDAFKRGLDIENVSYILQVANEYEAVQLQRVCTEVMIQNMEQVAKTKTFQDLDRSLIVQVMLEACRRISKASDDIPQPL